MFALEKNEDLVIEHESVNAAEAEVKAASGVYDPVLGVDGTWSKLKPPINSSFAGAPPGELASETESTDVGAGLRQYLPTGGELAVRGGGSRGTTDDTFTLLSPAYDTNAGVVRQPLLRDLTTMRSGWGSRWPGRPAGCGSRCGERCRRPWRRSSGRTGCHGRSP